MKEVIIQAGDNRYMGEFMEDLPENCILNKVLTGSGMTSVVLSNNIKYVLVVPYISLIENKSQWCSKNKIEYLAVYSDGSNEKDVASFLGNKIMVTYDSLEKVANALDERGDIKEWKVCIDECHKLIDSAIFRPNAITSVMNNYKRFKSFTFGTATPVPDKYQLPELRKIQKVNIVWSNIEPVKVNYCHYEKDIVGVGAITAIDFLKGDRQGNAHIFINSVNNICKIIRKMKQGGFNQPKDIRIVCAFRDININTIKRNLNDDEYYISPVDSEVKKVNFYTATAFEGCDIFDEEAHNIIITDGEKDHTKIDITTILPQIIGRVRNSKNKNTVELIYSNNDYIGITEDVFEQKIKTEIAKYKDTVNDFNTSKNEGTKEAIYKGLINNKYVILNDGNITLNEYALYNEMYNFSTHNQTYYVSPSGDMRGISDGTSINNSITYNYEATDKIEIKGLNKVKIGEAPSFKDLCIEYQSIPEGTISLKKVEIAEYEPLIAEGYKVLGESKIKALKYRKSAIQRELTIKKTSSSSDWKVVSLLNYKVGNFISKNQAKNDLQYIYDELGFNKTAKSTELETFYSLEETTRRVGGVKTAGYIIITSKINILTT